MSKQHNDDMWCVNDVFASLSRRIQALEVATLDAPIPGDYEYDAKQIENFKSPRYQEQEFAFKFSPIIYPWYVDEISRTFCAMEFWFQQREEGHRVSITLRNSVFKISLSCSDTELSLISVVMRPCMEGHSIYRLILFKLVALVRSNPRRVSCFKVKQPFMLNRRILSQLNFCHSASYMTLNMEEIDIVTAKAWGLENITDDKCEILKPEGLPSNELLNNETYVNDFYTTRVKNKKRKEVELKERIYNILDEKLKWSKRLADEKRLDSIKKMIFEFVSTCKEELFVYTEDMAERLLWD